MNRSWSKSRKCRQETREGHGVGLHWDSLCFPHRHWCEHEDLWRQRQEGELGVLERWVQVPGVEKVRYSGMGGPVWYDSGQKDSYHFHPRVCLSHLCTLLDSNDQIVRVKSKRTLLKISVYITSSTRRRYVLGSMDKLNATVKNMVSTKGRLKILWRVPGCERQVPPESWPDRVLEERKRETHVGRREETGDTNVTRIEKSKKNWFVVFTSFYYTKNSCLVKNGGSTESFLKRYFENTPSKNTLFLLLIDKSKGK